MRFLGGIFTLLLVAGVSSGLFSVPWKGKTKGMPRQRSDAERFANDILQFAETGAASKSLDHYIHELALPKKLPNLDSRSFVGYNATAVCTICQSMTKAVMSMRRKSFSTKRIQATTANLCTRLNIQTEQVCRGILQMHLPIILYVMDTDSSINLADVCGLSLRRGACSTVSERYNWTIKIDNNRPRKIAPLEADGTFKIVQLTDINYDPYYEPNGNPFCEELTCCRKGQNVTNTSGKVAGYWGDYNACDVPWHALENALDHVKNTHQDMRAIYFTGDLIDHGIWEITKEGTVESIVKIYDKMKKTFSNTPVYPVLGNHESYPLDTFAPNHVTDDDFSTKWLYQLIADLWIKYGWLPESTRQTILQGGFYTVSPHKGHRVIALNNNVCRVHNWWLLLEPRDPSGQLRWLADTLLEAEKNGEYVHILAHIPPGSGDCYTVWSREYRKIVNRFAHIITAQFNGHTRYDEFKVYHDLEVPNKPVTVAWNGGSITPYAYLNPNYKVYTVDAQTFGVVDIDTWMFNLTAANETPEKQPEWYKSYSFKEEYGLRDLSADSMHKWIVEASRNPKMLQQYHWNLYKRAEPSMKFPCEEKCLRYLLCSIVKTSSSDKSPCGFLSP